MPSESTDMPEQEHSIKARGRELFDPGIDPADSRSTKPFAFYLRETPAQPLSTSTRAVLWFAGIVVAVLLVAAIGRVSYRYGPGRRAPKGPRPAAESTTLEPSVDRVEAPR